MLSNLQEIKDLVSIRAVADYLGLEEEYGKRKFPGERTASIQLYKDNRFHDFGRNVDGDIFDLMIHVRGYTLKEAIAELKTAFNIKDSPVWENTVKEAWIAYLTFSQGRYKSVIRKLAEKHPDDCQIIADNEDGSICAHVPVAWIRISPPKQYTEEQRQQMGERMRRNVSENKGVQE